MTTTKTHPLLPGAAAPLRPWAHVTHDPRNQWLANRLADHHRAMTLAETRRWAIQYVQGALEPAYAAPADRDRHVRTLLTSYGAQGAVMAATFLQGWVEHRKGPEVDLEFYRPRVMLGLAQANQAAKDLAASLARVQAALNQTHANLNQVQANWSHR